MKQNVKVIYKKSLFEYLVRRGCNFLYSTRNRNNSKWQCYMFEHDEKLNEELQNYNDGRYMNEEENKSF